MQETVQETFAINSLGADFCQWSTEMDGFERVGIMVLSMKSRNDEKDITIDSHLLQVAPAKTRPRNLRNI